MSHLIKIKSTEITVNATPNTVSNATAVRIVHQGTGSTSHLITLANTTGTIGTFTIHAQSVEYLQKASTDTLSVDNGTDVTAVSIAFTN